MYLWHKLWRTQSISSHEIEVNHLMSHAYNVMTTLYILSHYKLFVHLSVSQSITKTPKHTLQITVLRLTWSVSHRKTDET